MKLVHKSVTVHSDVWRRLRLNAELSGVAVRDFLAFIINISSPIIESEDPESFKKLKDLARQQRQARNSQRTTQ